MEENQHGSQVHTAVLEELQSTYEVNLEIVLGNVVKTRKIYF